MTVFADDGFGETLLRHQVGQGAAGLQGLFFRAQQHVQPRDEVLAQPFRQFAAAGAAPPCRWFSGRHGAGRAMSCRLQSSAVMDSGAIISASLPGKAMVPGA